MFKVTKEDGTDGGARTHTALRPPDFESGASANSATSAHDKHMQRKLWTSEGRQASLDLNGRWI